MKHGVVVTFCLSEMRTGDEVVAGAAAQALVSPEASSESAADGELPVTVEPMEERFRPCVERVLRSLRNAHSVDLHARGAVVCRSVGAVAQKAAAIVAGGAQRLIVSGGGIAAELKQMCADEDEKLSQRA